MKSSITRIGVCCWLEQHAVLFPLGNRVLVGPTVGFQWVGSSVVSSIGSMTPGSTFINTSVGFKEGNFGGVLDLSTISHKIGNVTDVLSRGRHIGAQGGATVAGSSITQAEGFCGLGNPTSPAGCTVTSTTNTHDTVVGPFVGGYISHSIFSHVGVFVGYDYHILKDTKPNPTNPSGPSSPSSTYTIATSSRDLILLSDDNDTKTANSQEGRLLLGEALPGNPWDLV